MNFSFYRHLKLDGDLAPAMTPAGTPLHFTTNGQTLAPFFVADPGPSRDATRRTISMSDGTSPASCSVRSTPAWPTAPVTTASRSSTWSGTRRRLRATHSSLPRTDRISPDWRSRGLLSERERVAIRDAAEKARGEL